MTQPKFFKAVYHGEITTPGEFVTLPPVYYWARKGLQEITCDSMRPMTLFLWEMLDSVAEHGHQHFHAVASGVGKLTYDGIEGFYHTRVGGPVGSFTVTVLMPY